MTKKMLAIVLTAVIWAACLVPAKAQDGSAWRISSADGLPSNIVHDIAQDARGFVWIATTNGVCRYDGFHTVSLQNISCTDNDYIEGNISKVTPDGEAGLVWVRTSANIVACYDVTAERFVDYTARGDHNRPYARWIVGGGEAWLYGAGNGVRHVTRRDGHFLCTDYTGENGRLPDNSVEGVAADGAGNVWITTGKGTVVISRNGKCQAPLGRRRVIAARSDGRNMLVLDADGTLYAFDGRLRTVRRAANALPADIGTVKADCLWNGRWLLFTADRTLALDLKSLALAAPPELQLRGATICRDSTPGYIILSNTGGEVLILRPDGTADRLRLLEQGRTPTQRDTKIRAAAANGKLHIATNGNGLFVYDPARRAITRHITADRDHSTMSNMLLSIVAAGDGTLLVGNEAAGVTCIPPPQQIAARYVLPAPGSDNDLANTVRMIARRPDGSMVISTKDNALHTFATPNIGITPAGSTKACAFSYFTDRRGSTYIGTRGDGLYVDGTRYSKESATHHIGSNDIFDITQDGRGRLWVATWEGGLLVADDGDARPLRFKAVLNRSVDERRVRRVCIDGSGRLWAATCNGLYVADTRQPAIDNSSFRRFSRSDGSLPATNIICLIAARDGLLYIGGLGCGLIKARPDKTATRLEVEQITMADGLTNNNVRSIVEDRYGCIWAGTEEGLSRIDPRNNTVTSYRLSSMQAANVFAEGSAATTPDGTLVFGTFYGVLAVRPESVHEGGAPARRPAITAVTASGRTAVEGIALTTMAQSGSLSLPHDRNTIGISFSNMDFANAKSSFFMHRLDGVDEDWTLTTDNPHALYTNLTPGTYTFRCRAMTAGRLWSGDTVLTITIRQPWWNTWWAWLLYTAATTALATYLYLMWLRGFRLRQQMAAERQMHEFRLGFFTQVAHELRTPLALIKGAADKLADEADRPPSRTALQTVRRGVGRLMRQVNSLMEFRRISTGGIRLAVEHGDVVRFVRDVFQDFWQAARRKDLSYTMVPFAAAYEMPFDRNIVDTIVTNLLSNAIKYTPNGGTVTLRLALDGGMLAVKVEDSGPGISTEGQANLFKPFMHGYASSGGMGIGLYTARQMARAHKGDLTYSHDAGGTTFTATLPADGSPYAPSDYAQSPTPQSARTDGGADLRELLPAPMNDARVAVVEDDTDMAELLRTELGQYFHILIYSDGLQAVEAVTADPPRLLICDIGLPGIDGCEVVRRLRKDSRTARLPIIMLTAMADEEHALRAFKAGADDCTGKPCNMKTLAAKVARMMETAATRTHTEHASHEETPATKAEAPTATTGKVVLTRTDKTLADDIRRAVESRMADPGLTTEALAEALHISRTKLNYKMKELFGTSPNKYITDMRMQKAAELLRSERLTAAEVGYKVGIGNRSYFFKCFKEKYGVTPLQYAKGKPLTRDCVEMGLKGVNRS